MTELHFTFFPHSPHPICINRKNYCKTKAHLGSGKLTFQAWTPTLSMATSRITPLNVAWRETLSWKLSLRPGTASSTTCSQSEVSTVVTWPDAVFPLVRLTCSCPGGAGRQLCPPRSCSWVRLRAGRGRGSCQLVCCPAEVYTHTRNWWAWQGAGLAAVQVYSPPLEKQP